jgi:hypothetical protein
LGVEWEGVDAGWLGGWVCRALLRAEGPTHTHVLPLNLRAPLSPHLHIWERVLEQPDGALAQAVWVEGLLGRGRLQVVGRLRVC